MPFKQQKHDYKPKTLENWCTLVGHAVQKRSQSRYHLCIYLQWFAGPSLKLTRNVLVKTNIASEHGPSQKGELVFQPLLFMGELSVSWRVFWIWKTLANNSEPKAKHWVSMANYLNSPDGHNETLIEVTLLVKRNAELKSWLYTYMTISNYTLPVWNITYHNMMESRPISPLQNNPKSQTLVKWFKYLCKKRPPNLWFSKNPKASM